MSENEANPGTEGTNAQPPVAGQSPQPGTQPTAPAGPQTGYDPASPWMRPNAGQDPTGPAPQPPTSQVPVPQPPPAAPGPDQTSYNVQLPPSYGAAPAYQPGSYPPYQQQPTPGYGQGSYAQGSYSQGSYGANPYAQGAYGAGSPPPGTTPPATGASDFTGQTITGFPMAGSTTTGTPPGRPGNWRRSVIASVVGAAVALALIAGGVGGFVGYALHPDDNNSSLQNVAGVNRPAAAPIDRSDLAGIAKAVQPTVVSIRTQEGEGSGVVLSQDGYIVTNNHVVATANGADVQVTFNSGKNLTAKIVGTDPKTDIAVVKVDATGLTAASWGDSDGVQVGDTVLAIGSPLGLQGSVTAGIISALHRTIAVGDEQQQSPFQQQQAAPTTTIGDAIQTDAPINPGNSGGALVDTAGKVVGINSAIATSGSDSTGNIGVGFAISANKAKSVSDQLIKGGKVTHPYLGVSVGEAQNGGAQISSVQANSPAAQAGIQEGDVITKVNDRDITTGDDLVGAIQASSPGTKLTLTVVRNGSSNTVTATVGDQP